MSSDSPGTGGLLLAKLVCCGLPLLVIAVASGALALFDALAAATALAAVAVAVGLVLRRRERACPVEEPRWASPTRTVAARDPHVPARRRGQAPPPASRARPTRNAGHDLPPAGARHDDG